MSTATRVAIVTGANKGIGFAITKFLCQQFDGDVLLTARDAGRGTDAVKQIEQLNLKPPIFHQLDVDCEKSIASFKAFLEEKYGGIDVLVNNAAIAYKFDSKASTLEQAENTVRVNFFALRNICNALFPLLRKHARVVNLSSSAGMLPRVPGVELRARFAKSDLTEEEIVTLANEYLEAVKVGVHMEKGWPPTTYIASKVLVSALSFAQQRKLDAERPNDDIILNAVHPGYVDTDMTSHKGTLTIEQGADAPTYLALLPPGISEPRGAMVWCDRSIVNWVTG